VIDSCRDTLQKTLILGKVSIPSGAFGSDCVLRIGSSPVDEESRNRTRSRTKQCSKEVLQDDFISPIIKVSFAI